MAQKHVHIKIIAWTIMLMTISCGDMSDTERLKNEKNQLITEIAQKKDRIDEINNTLMEIDSTFRTEKYNDIFVTTIKVEEKPFIHYVDVSATVVSKGNILISAEVPGRISSVNVIEGQKVNKGEALVRLDTSVISASIKEAEKQYELVKVVAEKRTKLWRQKVGTEIEYLKAKNDKESLESKINTLRKQRNQFIIQAPFTGVIDKVDAKLGQMAAAGLPLINMVSTKGMYISADISERYLGMFDMNTKAKVKFPNIAEPFVTKIKSIGQVIKQINRTFVVEAKVPSFTSPYSPIPNMACKLSLIDYENNSAISLPTRIIFDDNKGSYVYIMTVKGKVKTAHKKRVTKGKTFAGKTEILSGLQPGIDVIYEGADKMVEGSRVKISKRSIE